MALRIKPCVGSKGGYRGEGGLLTADRGGEGPSLCTRYLELLEYRPWLGGVGKSLVSLGYATAAGLQFECDQRTDRAHGAAMGLVGFASACSTLAAWGHTFDDGGSLPPAECHPRSYFNPGDQCIEQYLPVKFAVARAVKLWPSERSPSTFTGHPPGPYYPPRDNTVLRVVR